MSIKKICSTVNKKSTNSICKNKAFVDIYICTLDSLKINVINAQLRNVHVPLHRCRERSWINPSPILIPHALRLFTIILVDTGLRVLSNRERTN